MITNENLECFCAVVENKGVIKASEKLFISVGSVTRSVQIILLLCERANHSNGWTVPFTVSLVWNKRKRVKDLVDAFL
jgi:hypothetical protein